VTEYYDGELVLAHADARADVAVNEPALRDRIAASWLLAQRRDNTRDAYRRDISQFFAWCDEFDIDALTANRLMIDGFRRWLQDGSAGRHYSDATVVRKMATLSSFYDYGNLEHEHLVPGNPAARVKRPQLDPKSMTSALSRDELDRLFAAAEASGTFDEAMVKLLFYTAVRATELCTARRSDLVRDGEHRALLVTRKGGRRDKVLLPPAAGEALDRHLGDRNGQLFVDRHGQPINRFDVAYRLSKLVAAAGIEGKKVTPHVLRHTAATMALTGTGPDGRKADVREVREMLGHRRLETTMRYDQSARDLANAAGHVLAEIMDTASDPGGMVDR
jgi:site-specific recombinase XerD